MNKSLIMAIPIPKAMFDTTLNIPTKSETLQNVAPVCLAKGILSSDHKNNADAATTQICHVFPNILNPWSTNINRLSSFVLPLLWAVRKTKTVNTFPTSKLMRIIIAGRASRPSRTTKPGFLGKSTSGCLTQLSLSWGGLLKSNCRE